jgi:hypothetical protein
LIKNELASQSYSLFKIKNSDDKAHTIKTGNTILLTYNQYNVDTLNAAAILTRDSLTGNYSLTCDNTIMVKSKFISERQRNLAFKGYLQGWGHQESVSYITLLSPKANLHPSGVLVDPLSVSYNGFWVYEKLANQLPFDYTDK